MTDTTKKVAKALEGDLTAKQCAALLMEVVQGLAECEPRRLLLHPGMGNIPQGAERRKVLLSGDTQAVEKMEGEYRTLQAIHDQLTAQRDELSRRRARAQAQEAYEGLPGLHQRLVGKVTAAEAAIDALEAALDEVGEVYGEIHQARVHARMGGYQPAGADTETCHRLAAFGEYTPRRRNCTQTAPTRHADTLGAASETVTAQWAERGGGMTKAERLTAH